MAITDSVTITKNWQKLSDDNCVVQSKYSTDQFCFAGSPTMPTDDNSLLVRIYEPTEISLNGAVWCKLPHSSTSDDKEIVVIK